MRFTRIVLTLNELNLYVKIGKECQESKAPECREDNRNPWVITLDEKELGRMDENGDKLYHLDFRQIPLPPEILSIFGTHSGQQVIGVHDDVHNGIDASKESAVSRRVELDT